MAVTYELTTQQDGERGTHTSTSTSNGTWEALVSDYYHRGLVGGSFKMVNTNEFFYVTSNNTKCRFVRKPQ